MVTGRWSRSEHCDNGAKVINKDQYTKVELRFSEEKNQVTDVDVMNRLSRV